MLVRIEMYVDVGSALLFDAVSLVVVWAYTLGEISFSDVDRNPPTTRPVLCYDIVSELPAAEGNWKFEDFVAIGTSGRADPIPCIRHYRHTSDKNGILPQSRVTASPRRAAVQTSQLSGSLTSFPHSLHSISMSQSIFDNAAGDLTRIAK